MDIPVEFRDLLHLFPGVSSQIGNSFVLAPEGKDFCGWMSGKCPVTQTRETSCLEMEDAGPGIPGLRGFSTTRQKTFNKIADGGILEVRDFKARLVAGLGDLDRIPADVKGCNVTGIYRAHGSNHPETVIDGQPALQDFAAQDDPFARAFEKGDDLGPA